MSYLTKKQLSNLKVGSKVLTEIWPEEKHIVRTILEIHKDKNCGSGYRVFLDRGPICPRCGKPEGICCATGGIDAAWCILVPVVPRSLRYHIKGLKHQAIEK